MLIFSVLGAVDLVIGNKFGLGEEFEKGFKLTGTLILSMVGMIVIAPFIGTLIQLALDILYSKLHIDPSLIPSMLFANDMGGAHLATFVAKDANLGIFNGLVVSSMLGCTISFTIPFALRAVKKEQHQYVLLGILCGIVTIPIGCLTAGIIGGISIGTLLFNILPILIFSLIIAAGLKFFPDLCVKIFSVFATILQIIIIIGLLLGTITFLTGAELIKGLSSVEEGVIICFNCGVFLSGALPFLHLVSKIASNPIEKLSKKLGIDKNSALGFLSTLAASTVTFTVMDKMSKKGVILNSAFAVSAAFLLADHLAFTMSFNPEYVGSVLIGKLVSGVTALLLAIMVSKKVQ